MAQHADVLSPWAQSFAIAIAIAIAVAGAAPEQAGAAAVLGVCESAQPMSYALVTSDKSAPIRSFQDVDGKKVGGLTSTSVQILRR